MKDPLAHLMIIWSKGLSIEEEILLDISNNFDLLNIFCITWEDDLFSENLKRFYAHSQKDKTEIEYNHIINNKIEHCGKDAFTVLVFEDSTPNFTERKTSNGTSIVNANVFDRKAKYRKSLGGGHQIHASDNYFETNKDIAMLFGCTVEDFRMSYPTSEKKVNFSKNSTGVPNWSGFEQFFFVLNNSINYVVLRNFENLPENHQVASHGDVDILVEDLNFIKYLTGAKAVFPNDPYRVHYTVEFRDEQIPFDFRFLGDNYYDIKWQLNILKNRVFHRQSFYIPDDKNHFFALLYHAYIQKRKIAKDYKIKLRYLAEKIHETYREDISDSKAFDVLNEFMQAHGYNFVLPQDISVFFNKMLIEKRAIGDLQNGGGTLVSSTITRTTDNSFITEVYKRDEVFIKIATNPICENEYRFLTTLKEYDYFPSCISVQQFDDTTKIEMSAINGIEMRSLNDESSFWKLKNIAVFMEHSINILIILLKHNISHRDIRLPNLLVEKKNDFYYPRLFDFGWSASLSDINPITPITLGHTSKWKGEGFSDAYSIGVCLDAKFGRIMCVRPIIDKLLKISAKEYTQPEKLIDSFNGLKRDCSQLSLRAPLRDKLFITLKKYKLMQKSKSISYFLKKQMNRK